MPRLAALALVLVASAALGDELPDGHAALVVAFVEHRREGTPIAPLPPDSLTEADAYRIADAFVDELLKTEGAVGGYKVGTFAAGQFDDGPVDGFTGPVTAVMFESGLLESGATVPAACCHFTFVEADFAAVVGSDAINDAGTDLEILAALAGFRPFIEMPDILRTAPGGSRFSGIATNYDFRYGVLGDLIQIPATEAGIRRLNTFRYEMTNERGELLGSGRIEDAYEPLYRVRAIRDRIRWRGRRLEAGDVLSLGNMGTIRPLKDGIYMEQRPRFVGNVGTVTYYGLDEAGPARVSVTIAR